MQTGLPVQAGLHIPRLRGLEALRGAGLADTIRPQELSVDNWIALASAL